MLRELALVTLLSAALDGTAALADARQDCLTMRADAAIRACDLAIAENPRDPQAYKSRGDAYLAKGNLDGVIADYAKAIEIDPSDALAYNNQGYAYEHKGDFERAGADFDKAIEVDLRIPDGYINRCWLRGTTNRDLTLAFADCEHGSVTRAGRRQRARQPRAAVSAARPESRRGHRGLRCGVDLEPEAGEFAVWAGTMQAQAWRSDWRRRRYRRRQSRSGRYCSRIREIRTGLIQADVLPSLPRRFSISS